jgi:sulfonate transport system permease protein
MPTTEAANGHGWNRRGWWLPAGLLLFWQLASWLQWVRPIFLPSPETVVDSTIARWRGGYLGPDLSYTLGRVAFGFLVGSAFGLAAGIGLGVTRIGERYFGNFFNAVRQVPVPGWVPLLILWFGVGEGSRLAFIAVGVFFPVALNTASGLVGVPRQYRELGVVYQLGFWERLWRITLPSALPSLKAAALQGLNMAWVSLVAAELLTSQSAGLANQINLGREAFKMDLVYSGVLLIAVFGALSQWGLLKAWELCLGRFERR